MSGRCGHELRLRGIRVEFAPGVESAHIDRNRRTGKPIRSVIVDASRCMRCNTWLPLGHSDETPERVAVEIRAVEVVNARAAQRPDLVTTDEFYGWTLHECDSTSGDLRADVEAGWLARCIWTHCDDHPDKDETP